MSVVQDDAWPLTPSPWAWYRTVTMEGELTSVKVSQDSRYALINRALDPLGVLAVSAWVRSSMKQLTYPTSLQEIHLWDISTERTVHKYTGHRQSRHVIRSGFGGVGGNFVISGSEGKRHSRIWVFVPGRCG